MNIEIIEPETIQDNWKWMVKLLAPAIAIDQERTENSVKEELAGGYLTAWIVVGENYTGLMITKMNLVAWLVYSAGKFKGGPRKVRASMREIMNSFETAARRGNASELHFTGRKKWQCIFPDYEFDGTTFRRVL